MKRYYLKGMDTRIDLDDFGMTITSFPDEHEDADVKAWPEDTEEYRARAVSLGYGDDTMRMAREHEVVHTLLAQMLGLKHSPVLYNIATGRDQPPVYAGGTEEEAVLAIQRLCNLHRIDVMALLERASIK